MMSCFSNCESIVSTTVCMKSKSPSADTVKMVMSFIRKVRKAKKLRSAANSRVSMMMKNPFISMVNMAHNSSL